MSLSTTSSIMPSTREGAPPCSGPRNAPTAASMLDDTLAPVQQALAAVGIPAVAAGKQSLFATPEARDLLTLLLALARAEAGGAFQKGSEGEADDQHLQALIFGNRQNA